MAISMEQEFLGEDPDPLPSSYIEALLDSEERDILMIWEQRALREIRETLKGEITQGSKNGKGLGLVAKAELLEEAEDNGTITDENKNKLNIVRGALVARESDYEAN